MEPFLLLELSEGPAYGYDLARTMGVLGFKRAAEDPSTVYKLLRNLEERSYVSSSWLLLENGAPRRMYELLPAGHRYLHERAKDLRREAQRVAQFLDRYQHHFPDEIPNEAEIG